MLSKSIMQDITELLFNIKKQLVNKNQSHKEEPQANIVFKNGRRLKVTRKKNSSNNEQSYYTWQVYCSPEEMIREKFNNTHGCITKYVSNTLNKGECINILYSIKYVTTSVF